MVVSNWYACKFLKMKQLLVRSIVNKFVKLTKNCKTNNQKRPNPATSQCFTTVFKNQLAKIERVGAQSSSSPTILLRLLATNYHIFKHLDQFLTGQTFNNHDQAKRLLVISLIPEHPVFTLKECINLYHVSKCVYN